MARPCQQPVYPVRRPRARRHYQVAGPTATAPTGPGSLPSATMDCGPTRLSARSVSWNADGTLLAMTTSDRTVRIWNIEYSENTGREVAVLAGHNGPISAVRCHPSDPHRAATTSQDGTIRLWDLRTVSSAATNTANTNPAPPKRATHTLTLSANERSPAHASTLEWQAKAGHDQSQVFAVTDKPRNSIHILDSRMLASTTATTTSAPTSTLAQPVASFEIRPFLSDGPCCFVPGQADHVTTAVTNEYDGAEWSEIWTWNWKKSPSRLTSNVVAASPAHTGPVSTLQYSAQGRFLVTGGADACVGIWQSARGHTGSSPLSCIDTIYRTKYIRHCAFTPDERFLAVANEQDGVYMVQMDESFQPMVPFWLAGVISSRAPGRAGGAQELAWNPKYKNNNQDGSCEYVLASARVDPGFSTLPVAVTKVTMQPR
jgi:WD40 repeat protein